MVMVFGFWFVRTSLCNLPYVGVYWDEIEFVEREERDAIGHFAPDTHDLDKFLLSLLALYGSQGVEPLLATSLLDLLHGRDNILGAISKAQIAKLILCKF